MSIAHTSTRDGKFRGYDLPKDTIVYANFYAVHTDPGTMVQRHRG